MPLCTVKHAGVCMLSANTGLPRQNTASRARSHDGHLPACSSEDNQLSRQTEDNMTMAGSQEVQLE